MFCTRQKITEMHKEILVTVFFFFLANSNSNKRKTHNTAAHDMDFYLFICIFLSWTFSPVPLKHVSHAFNPLPAEHVHSLGIMVVKGHIATHLSDVNQWRKQSAELQENLLTHPRDKNKKQTAHFQFTSKRSRTIKLTPTPLPYENHANSTIWALGMPKNVIVQHNESSYKKVSKICKWFFTSTKKKPSGNISHAKWHSNVCVSCAWCIEIMYRKDQLLEITGILTNLHRVCVIQAGLRFILNV